MIAFEFGNLCFNSPASEQSIIMVIASPSEFSSLDKFITAALTFLETDGELYGKRTVLYKERVNLPASNEDKERQKKIAQGHAQDDHEEEQTWQQAM